MQCLRFIPAPAGNVLRDVQTEPAKTVHPRACGERNNSVSILRVDNGSSPRLRGTWGVGRRTKYAGRFIPAPAGNVAAGR